MTSNYHIVGLKKYYTDPLYRNSIAYMLNTLSGAMFGIIFWIIAARTISPNDIGLSTAIISVCALIITLAKLGMDNGLIRFIPQSKNRNELYSTTIIIACIISIIFTLIFLIGVDFFSPSLGFLRYGWFPLILIIYNVVGVMYVLQNIMFIALRRGDLSLIQCLILGIRVPALLLLAAFGVFGILTVISIAYIIAFIVGIFLIYHIGIKFVFSLDTRVLSESIGFSFGNYTASIFSIAPTAIIPILIVNTIGAENSAYYYVAYSIAMILFTIPNSISTALFAEGSNDLPIGENVLKSLKLAMLLLIPSIIVIFLLGDKFLMLFSSEYSVQSFELLKLLAISSVFSTITSIYISIKKIKKEIRIINYINLLLSVSLVIVGYLSLIFFGLMGIGYTWIILNLLTCIFVIYLIYKYDKYM